MKATLVIVALLVTGCAAPYKGPVQPMDSARVYQSSSGGFTVHDRYGNKVLDYTPNMPRRK